MAEELKDEKTEDKKDPSFSHEEIENKSLEELLSNDDGDDFEDAEKQAQQNGTNADGTPKVGDEVQPEGKKTDDEISGEGTGGDNNDGTDDKSKTEEPDPTLEHIRTLNTDELKKQISAEVAQTVVDALTGGEDKGKTEDDQVKKLVADAPWVKENRNPTYDEVIAWTIKSSTPLIKQQVIEEFKKEAEEEEKKEADAIKEQTETQEKADKAWSDYWATQMVELEDAGKIPPLKNEDGSINEKAKQVRLNLFKTMKEVSVARQKEGKPAVTNLKEVFAFHYKDDSEVPGADAPINGARKTTTADDPNNFDYNEIHNSSFDDILGGSAQN